MKEVTILYNSLHNGNFHFSGFHSFTICEHGKVRDIDALGIRDRTVQKCLCQYFLIPLLSGSFVYDNSASLKNKGMDFSLDRLEKQLRTHYNKYKLEGGIYQFDFKSYFASLDHHIMKDELRRKIKDDKLYEICSNFIDDFQMRKTADLEGDPKGVGLGSEVSQILALNYCNYIDHYIKEVLKIKGYGRYMDDGYIISNSIKELEQCKKKIYQLADELKIKMNDKKNIIIPFKNHGFVFLKIHFRISETGKIIRKLSRKSTKAMKHKLKTFRRWLDTNKNKMSAEDVFASYQSWRAHAKRCDSYKILRSTDILFVQLFKEELRVRKQKFPCTLKAVKNKNGWHYMV